jgi:hypothetical protein
MRASAFVVIVPAVLVLSACTAIVAGQLSKTDGYPTTTEPGVDLSAKCSLTDGDASTNACSTCIATNCANDVAIACNGADKGGDRKPWFPNLQSCAENPTEGYTPGNDQGWGCSMYTDSTLTPINADDDSAEERASQICVRDKCITTPASPCHQCTVTYMKPGSGSDYGSLDDSACGRCLRAACPDVLRECCTNLPEGFAQCGYVADMMDMMSCLGAADAGSARAEAGTGSREQCTYEVATYCFTPTCLDLCQKGM